MIVDALCLCGLSEDGSAASQREEELDAERQRYQNLLKEFGRLEQRYDNLREMSLLTEVHNYTYRHT